MLGTLELTDPDGVTVLVSPEAAEILRGEGYTDAPPVVHVFPAPDDVDPDPAPGPDPEPDPDDEPTVKDPAAPRGNASRADWAAYADQLGLQVANEDSREDIKSAVAALEQ